MPPKKAPAKKPAVKPPAKKPAIKPPSKPQPVKTKPPAKKPQPAKPKQHKDRVVAKPKKKPEQVRIKIPPPPAPRQQARIRIPPPPPAPRQQARIRIPPPPPARRRGGLDAASLRVLWNGLQGRIPPQLLDAMRNYSMEDVPARERAQRERQLARIRDARRDARLRREFRQEHGYDVPVQWGDFFGLD